MQQASQSGDENAIGKVYGTLADQMKKNTNQEKRAIINDYIDDSRPYNNFLRSGGNRNTTLGQNIGPKVDKMEQAMTPTGADIKTYRGVSSVGLRHILSNSGNKKLKKAVKRNGAIDYNYLQKNKNLLVGLEFTEKGFSSTSVQQSYAEEWRKGLPARETEGDVNNQLKKKFLKSDMKDEGSSAHAIMKSMGVDDFDKLDALDQVTTLNNMSAEHWDDYSKIKSKVQGQNLYQGHMFEINVPKGTKAGMIDMLRMKNGRDTDAGQKEMLLGKNTRFKINKMVPMLDEKGNALKDQFRFLMDVVDQD